MTAHSRDISDRDDGPAILSRRGLARQQRGALRLIAAVLIGSSIAGAVLWGGGGVGPWLALAPNWVGVAAAGILQGIVSWLQYVFCERGFRSPVYTFALGISTTLSTLGYWPLIGPALIAFLRWAQVPDYSAPIVAGIAVFILLGLIDIIPEKILTV